MRVTPDRVPPARKKRIDARQKRLRHKNIKKHDENGECSIVPAVPKIATPNAAAVTMLEPRGALHSTILRRESVASEQEALEPERPEQPVHDQDEEFFYPLLEYEQPPAAPEQPRVLIPSSLSRSFACTCMDAIRTVAASQWSAIRKSSRSNSRNKRKNDVKLLAAFLGLIISGVGTVVSSKLQAIPMRNYPNFLNLFGTIMYIPFCFAYLSNTNMVLGGANAASASIFPGRKRLKQFAVMGALDCLSTTLQTFASVYLPLNLLVLLPQAAIPVSLALTVLTTGRGVSWMQCAGACTVLVGIFVVLQPVLAASHSPDFYCQAQDQENDCTICQVALTEQDCLSKSSTTASSATSTPFVTSSSRWLEDFDDPVGNDDSEACRWLPFAEASQEKEFLEIVWSLLLILSTIPMALSALYKQRAMRSLDNINTTSDEAAPVLYVSGWIAVFQFCFSLVVAIPAGLAASQSTISENLVNGMLCYAGHGVKETGCHPDAYCSSQHAALWTNVTVLCHVVYTVSVMLVLKYSMRSGDGTSLLFLALTAIVPICHLVFVLPILPVQSRTVVRTGDIAGLCIILLGLVGYRFSSDRIIEPTSSTGGSSQSGGSVQMEDALLHQGEEDTLMCSLLWPIENQTSFALLREPILTGDV